jgi:hypothetical protein
MTALQDPATAFAADIIDLAGFRGVAAARPPADAPARDPGDHDPVVVRFAEAAARHRPPRGAPVEPSAEVALLSACEQLVASFRVMHEAVIELVVSCRDLDDATSRTQAGTEDVMLGLAVLTTATERFQQQLSSTVGTAFR